MFESEVYSKKIEEIIPEKLREEFIKTFKTIRAKSSLHWTEHCTECAMPSCFSTCDLYVPRIDGKCERFTKGIQIISLDNNLSILKIGFKKWGVYSTQANAKLYSIEEIKDQETKDMKIANLIDFNWPKPIKKNLIKYRYGVKKKKLIYTRGDELNLPEAFLYEIYNPLEKEIFITLIIRNDDEKYRKMPFQYKISLKPGYNKEAIPFEEINKRIKIDLSFRIDFIPDNIDENAYLYFGVTDFVQFHRDKNIVEKSKKVKCVVWDLDNTIWDGVLVEDGIDKLVLKDGIKEILQEIENKGIINSIASKNDMENAMLALRHFQIEDYFLFPKISWNPKSLSIKQIADDLNIGKNTLLFIDDSVFEREEVESTHSDVKVVDALFYNDLLKMEEFQIPITEESKKRKEFYKTESIRKEDAQSFDGEYLGFLKSCGLQLEIHSLSSDYFPRVYELTQRTNQMNFSGNRYKLEDLDIILKDSDLEAYVLSCSDKFGEYGIIGFGIVKKSENRLIDLMFSCRIQSKRVEHAFITYCLKKYLNKGDFHVTYKPTERNKFSAQVFYDFEFKILDEKGEDKYLVFDKNKEFIDDKIISISEF